MEDTKITQPSNEEDQKGTLMENEIPQIQSLNESTSTVEVISEASTSVEQCVVEQPKKKVDWADDNLDEELAHEAACQEREIREREEKKIELERKSVLIGKLCYNRERAKFNENSLIYIDNPFTDGINEDDLSGNWVRLTEKKFDWGEFSGCYIPPSLKMNKSVTLNMYNISCVECRKRKFPVGYDGNGELANSNDGLSKCMWSLKSGVPLMCNQNLEIMRDVFHLMRLHDTLKYKDEINCYKHLVSVDLQNGKPIGLDIGPGCYKVKFANGMETEICKHMQVDGISPNEKMVRRRETAKFLIIAAKSRAQRTREEKDEFNRYEDKYMLKFGLYDKDNRVKSEFNIEAHLQIVYQRVIIMLRYFKFYFQGDINMRTPGVAIEFKKDLRNESLNLLHYNKIRDSTLAGSGHLSDSRGKVIIREEEETSVKQVYSAGSTSIVTPNAWNTPFNMNSASAEDMDIEGAVSLSDMIKDIRIFRGTRMQIDESGKKINTVLGPLPYVMPCTSTKLIIIELQRAHMFPVGYKIDFDVLFTQSPLSCYRIILSYVIKRMADVLNAELIIRTTMEPLMHNVSTFASSKLHEIMSVSMSFTTPSSRAYDAIEKHIKTDHAAVQSVYVLCNCICDLVDLRADSFNFCEECVNKKVNEYQHRPEFANKKSDRALSAYLQYVFNMEKVVERRMTMSEAIDEIKSNAESGKVLRAMLKCLTVLRSVLSFKNEICRTCAGLVFAVASGFATYQEIPTPYVPVGVLEDVPSICMEKVHTWTILGGIFQLASVTCNMPKLSIDSESDIKWKKYISTTNVTYNDPSCLTALLIRHVMTRLSQGQSMRLSAFTNDRIVLYSDDNMDKDTLIWNCFGAASGMWKNLIRFCMKSIDVTVAGSNSDGSWSEKRCSLRLPYFDNLYPRIDKAVTIELGKTSAEMLAKKNKSVYIPKVTFHIYDTKGVQRYNVSHNGLSDIAKKFNWVLEMKDKEICKSLKTVPNAKGTGLIFKHVGQNDNKLITENWSILKNAFNDYMMSVIKRGEIEITLLDLIAHSIMMDLALNTFDIKSFKLHVVCKIGKLVFFYPVDEMNVIRKECDDASKITVRTKPVISSIKTIEDTLYKYMM